MKITDPASTGDVFTFLASFDVSGGNTFELEDEESETFELDPGNYVVSEIGLPGGWESDGVDCDNGDSFNSAFANVTLHKGDEVTCTFFNFLDDDPTGDLRIVKETDPDVTGAEFDFESDELGDFTLEDNESILFEDLEADETYSITEILPHDWDLHEVICDDGDFSVSGTTLHVTLAADELTTCTFYNVEDDDEPREPGIDLEKLTNGEDADRPTGPLLAEGSAVTWTFVVTNTGDVTLHDVAIVDDNGTLDDDDDIVVASGLTLEPGESVTAVLTGIAEFGQFRNDAWAYSECGGAIADASDADRCDGPSDHDASHYLVPPTPPTGLPNGGSGGVADFFQPGVSLWATLSALAAGLLFIGGARPPRTRAAGCARQDARVRSLQ